MGFSNQGIVNKVEKDENKAILQGIFQKFAAFAGLIVLCVLFSITTTNFLTGDNLITIALQVAVYAILGFGLSYVLITGGTDLSVGSILAFSGVICAKAIVMGAPIWVGVLIALLFSALAGALNGFAVTKMNVTPFIATLGTQWVFRGLTQIIADGKPVSVRDPNNPALAEAFYFIGGGKVFGIIPFPVILMVILAVVLGVVLAKTGFGRRLYAVGSNEEAARLSGINVTRTKMGAYMISGTLAGLSGIILAARLVSAQSNAGAGYELEGIAAAVIGGVSIMGGEGTILGTVIGAFIMGILRNGLNLNGINSFWQQVIIGSIIVVAVYADTIRRKKRS